MAKTLYWYWVYYCYTEGLTHTSERSKSMIMFLFYGQYLYNGEKTSIIHQIRRSVMSDRYRFSMTKNKTDYDLFESEFGKNPHWEKFPDDIGKGKAYRDP